MTPAVTRLVCAALALYLAAIVTLSAFPWPPNWLEWVVIVLAVAAFAGLVALATPGLRLPGEHWAYLITGGVGLVSLLAYELVSAEPGHVRTRLGLFLAAGVIGAYGAHLRIRSDRV